MEFQYTCKELFSQENNLRISEIWHIMDYAENQNSI